MEAIKAVLPLAEMGIAGLAVGVLAIMVWRLLKLSEKQHTEHREDIKTFHQDRMEDNEKTRQVIEELKTVISYINRNRYD